MENSTKRRLRLFVTNLIQEYLVNNKFDFDKVAQIDKETFAALLIESDGRSLEFFTENDFHDDMVSSVIKLLTKDSSETRAELAETFQQNIVHHYEHRMIDLISQYLPDVIADSMWEKGLRPDYSSEGELAWR